MFSTAPLGDLDAAAAHPDVVIGRTGSRVRMTASTAMIRTRLTHTVQAVRWLLPALVLLSVCVRPADAGDPAAAGNGDGTTGSTSTSFFRIFLKDGTALASFGEFARVGQRIVFTLPMGQDGGKLATVSAGDVDWERTDRYSQAVRATQYAGTRGDAEFAAMSDRVARMLTDITITPGATSKLALAERARRELAAWPAAHHGYKSDEVRQMLGVLDEVLASLRASAGETRFDVNLVAGVADVPRPELLPAPSLQESVAQALRLSELAESSTERIDLFEATLRVLDRADLTSVPAGTTTSPRAKPVVEPWRTLARTRARDGLATEQRIDRAYSTLIDSALKQTAKRAANADVRAIVQTRARVIERDHKLGARRPDRMRGLLATLDHRLDSARRLRLARDQWASKQQRFAAYERAIAPAVAFLTSTRQALGDIKALAGPDAEVLKRLNQRLRGLGPAFDHVTAPADFTQAHASLVSAWRLTATAVRRRQQAIAQNQMPLAWDASAAAAGALMLFDRASQDIAAIQKAPELP